MRNSGRRRVAAWAYACCALVAFVGIIGSPLVRAAEADFLGAWLLALDHRPAGASFGALAIERSAAGLRGYIDGGPAPLTIDGDAIALEFDWDDGGGTVYVSELRGRLVAGRLAGEVLHDGAETGTWEATRRANVPGLGERAQPVDLSGTWRMLTDDGTGKNTFALTPAAAEFQRNFDARFDDPVLRCVSDGLVRETGGPFANEIIMQNGRITILYEDMHEIRRIYLGGEFPEDVDTLDSPLGYSIGHWEGSTLVVETRGLKAALWHRAGGKPISSEAKVTEYMYLADDGRLHVELTLEDPDNYVRPPQRHTVFAAAPGYEFTYYACDPDGFYRGLYLENLFDHYYGRSRYRR